MRIIGGVYKGRRLITPKGIEVRPTLQRTREAIFNVIAYGLAKWVGSLEDAIVLDLFCGTGALGIEALSRGAAHVTFVEISKPILDIAKRNAPCEAESNRHTTFLKLDATMLPPPPLAARCPCSIAFLDPPYGKRLAVPALLSLEAERWLKPRALAILEISAEEDFLKPSSYRVLETRLYGVTRIIFLEFRG